MASSSSHSSTDLFDMSGVHCRSAPDFLALEYGVENNGTSKDRNAAGFRVDVMKSSDYLSVPGVKSVDRSTTPPPHHRHEHPQAQYSKVSERLRQMGSSSPTVHRFQCGTFCGGKGCKYENPLRWGKEKGVAFNGLFSHWVTDSIVAMARPSTLLFTDYNLLNQFKEAGINAIINLQTPGEHAHCGPGQELSGFTYKPEDLMKNDIYFYNYHWPDYGTAGIDNILDVVKVIDFSVSNGKVGIHCHAGLGRTGAAIACYLVYSERISTEDAIKRVREKRPDSIQTRGQLDLIGQFSLHLLSLWTLYPCFPSSLSLDQYMERQSKLLHGEELEQYKHIPKVLQVLCNRLKELGEGQGTYKFEWCSQIEEGKMSVVESPPAADSWLVVSYSTSNDWSYLKPDSHCNDDTNEHLIQSLLGTSPCCHSNGFQKSLSILKDEINNQWTWDSLSSECDPTVLFSLLFTYLSHLKEPVIPLGSCYHANLIEGLSKTEKAILTLLLETVKTIIPSIHLITYFSAIAVHIIKFLCHCSSEEIEDNSTTSNYLLHHIMDYFQ